MKTYHVRRSARSTEPRERWARAHLHPRSWADARGAAARTSAAAACWVHARISSGLPRDVLSRAVEQKGAQRVLAVRQALEADAETGAVSRVRRDHADYLAVGYHWLVSGEAQRDAYGRARRHRQRRAQEQAAATEVYRGPEDSGLVVLEPTTAAHCDALGRACSAPGLADAHGSWFGRERKHKRLSSTAKRCMSIAHLWDSSYKKTCFLKALGKHANESGKRGARRAALLDRRGTSA